MSPDPGTAVASGLRLALLLSGAIMLSACGDGQDIQRPADADAEVNAAGEPVASEEIDPVSRPPAVDIGPDLQWDDLIPADWQPEALLHDQDVDQISDDDPRAYELMGRLRALWARAPLVAALDGRHVRLSGLLMPLDSDGREMTEFLLVPYFGACIHVPPPRANQTVHVVTAAGAGHIGEMFDSVEVEGRMRILPDGDRVGDAGYMIEDARVGFADDAM